MLLAITQRVEVGGEHQERRDVLDQRWAPFLAALGAVGIPVPNHLPTARAVVETLPVQAVLLSGGGNLGMLGGNTPERDEAEGMLLDWCIRRERPVIGVCRGMQFVAARFGARLSEQAGHVATRHPITDASGSLRHGGAGEELRLVNSYHHYCLAALPDGFDAVALAADGSVEAMRHRTLPVLTVMWHPEREPGFAAADLALFRDHLEA